MVLNNQSPYPQNLLVTIYINQQLSEQQFSRLNEAISQLTQKQQQTLLRYFRDHKSQADLAKEEHVRPSAIRKRISKAIIHLRWQHEYILAGGVKNGVITRTTP